ncbi:EF hand family protein [Histomonas meleagridis]|uniref:EF hand family protein n=1 Tax=Histomonas meleagridis TaxID=135588 RepID=UPI0035598E37|nr:EF hand family protein [Histomonas meleagridis]KAH0806639.1 EF hand family protein [Histomonas meleagridis]
MEEIYQQIKAALRKKGLTIQDAFDDLDIKHTGKITVYRFRRFFTNLSIFIDEKLFQQLVDKYICDPEEGDIIKYFKFIDDYNNSFSTPTLKPISSENWNRFSGYFVSRNTNVVECLKPYDRFHRGTVDIQSFYACFGTSTLIKDIAAHYLRTNNEVSYYDLESDMQKFLKQEKLNSRNLSQNYTIPSNIAKDFLAKGIDPYKTFLSQDKYKRKCIPKEQFVDDLHKFGTTASKEQIEELTRQFSNLRGFDYVAFCDALEKQQNKERLEETRLRNQKISLQTKEFKPINIEELLKRIQNEVQTRRSLIAERLRHFDPKHKQVLPCQMFSQIMRSEGFDLNRDELKALFDKYSENEDIFKYEEFITDITPISNQNEQIYDQFERLKEFLARKRLQIRPLMEKLDPYCKGTITFPQLMFVFRNINYDVNQKEMKLIKSRTTTNVNINEFCSIVDPIFKEEKKEEEEEEHEEEVIPKIPNNDVLEILAKIKSILEEENIDLKSEFLYYKLPMLNYCGPPLFQTVLVKNQIPISQKEISILIKYYYDTEKELVNFNQFINDIYTYGNDQLTLNPSLSLSTKIQKSDLSKEVISLIRRLKVILQHKNLNGTSIFRTYDPTKAGYVLRKNFVAVLNYIGFPATKEELEMLMNAFQSQRMKEKCSYRRLLLAMEEEQIQPSDLASVKVSHESEKNDYAFINIINTIHSKLSARRKNARFFFADIKEEKISVSEFRQRIMNFGIIISSSDIQNLIRYYRADLNDGIDWKRFCNDVDSSKTM